MTNPPAGGSATTSTTSTPPKSEASSATAAGGHETAKSGDAGFGATTLSGRSVTGNPAAGTSAPTAPPSTPDSSPGRAGGNPPRTEAGRPADQPTTGLPGTSPTSSGIRAGRNRGPRRARLQIRHVNPVTVLKFSCVLAVALFFVWLIIVGVLFGVLDAAGVIGHINDLVTQLNGEGSKPPVTAGIVFGGAAIIGVINIVLFIALSTIGAVIYNLCADLVGGIEITLSER